MRAISAFAVLLLLSGASVAQARADDGGSSVAGHFQVRLRGLAVLPDASAVTYVGGVNSQTTSSATNSFEPEVDGTYFLTDHIGVELIAAVTHHSVHNSALGNVGSVWLLPPTLTVQYHLQPTAWFRPYVGAGINYTWFFSPKSQLVSDLHFSDNVGWALQAGFDVPVGDGPYFFNIDAKKLFLKTTASSASAGVVAHATLDPWIIGAGVGVRF